MEPSIYIDYIERFFAPLSLGVVEKLNGSENPLPYFHTQFLRPEFSVSGKWEALSINNTLVSADYVAMDSSLPLKMRDTYGKATGDIPKVGMEMKLNEQQLTDIDTMIAMNVADTTIAARLFNDIPRVIGGIYEKNEYAFLKGLSTGVTIVDSDTNTGVGIRIDFAYKAENKFGASTVWSDPNSTPITDMRNKFLAKARLDGKRLVNVLTDPTVINNMLKTQEVKDLFALSIGNFGTTKPAPTQAQLVTLLQRDYGINLVEIDRSITIEKNGTRSVVKPWQAGMVVATTTATVGPLFYARLAEENHPTEGVTYQKVNDYILVSRFRLNRPSLAEITNSQARVVPIVSETVYTLDSTVVQA